MTDNTKIVFGDTVMDRIELAHKHINNGVKCYDEEAFRAGASQFQSAVDCLTEAYTATDDSDVRKYAKTRMCGAMLASEAMLRKNYQLFSEFYPFEQDARVIAERHEELWQTIYVEESELGD